MEFNLQSFIAFIESKPADEEIDHTYGFDTCAFGEFCSICGVDSNNKSFNVLTAQEKTWMGLPLETSNRADEFNFSLMSAINNATVAIYLESIGRVDVFGTYGDYQQWIKKLTHLHPKGEFA